MPTNIRIPVWKAVTLDSIRRRRRARRFLWVAIVAPFVGTCVWSYFGGWWTQVLDWAVVAIPTIAGLVAWVMPITQTTQFHRRWLFMGGVTLSCLIWLQQWEADKSHAREMARLATKEDIAKLPTLEAIGLEIKKAQSSQVVIPAARIGRPNKEGSASPKVAPGESPKPASSGGDEEIKKRLDDIKKMIGGEYRWGLTPDQLVVLAQRMSPYTSTFNNWSSGGDFITSVLGNPDSARFAASVVATLRSIGWNLPGSGFSQAVFTGTPPEGVIVVIHAREDAHLPILDQFLGVLKASGISFHGEIQDTEHSGQFQIIVGAKPQ